MKKSILLVFVGVVFMNSLVLAQDHRVMLPHTEMRTIHSENIDQDFEIYVKLPRSYELTDTLYPVLYTTDANRSFPVYSTASLIYETPGYSKRELIIVGIGYQVDRKDPMKSLLQWALWRNRDLRPDRSLESEKYWQVRFADVIEQGNIENKTGGGANFLQFIQEELIPFVEAHYRVSKTDRGIAGYSLGGLFTLYTFFHAPGTFTRYFAGSPSLMNRCLEYERTFSQDHSDLKAHLLITANGTEHSTLSGMQKMTDLLNPQHYPHLKVDTCVFYEDSHLTGQLPAINKCLEMLYYKK